jgi:sensor domain CHASE-containing protein
MEVFKWIAVIVAVVMIAEVWKYKIKNNNRQAASDQELETIRTQLEKLDDLEQRVRTLEKIVTDPRDNLKREINSL